MTTRNEKQKPAPGPGPTPAPAPTPPAGGIPVPPEFAEVLGIQPPGKQDFPLICPHCNEPVREVLWRTFGDPGTVAITGCGKCRKVLGAQLLPRISY